MKALFSMMLICAGALYASITTAKESMPMVTIRNVPILSRCQLERAQSIQYLGNNNFRIMVTPDCESGTMVAFTNKEFKFYRTDQLFSDMYKNKKIIFFYDKDIIGVTADSLKYHGDIFDFYIIYGKDEYKKLSSGTCKLSSLNSFDGIHISKYGRIFISKEPALTLFDGRNFFYSDEIFNNVYLHSVFYDIEKNIEYTAWKKDNKYYFKSYSETGYNDVATYDRGPSGEEDIDESRAFIIKDDFFIFEQLDTFPPEEDVYEVRIMHLGPGKEAVEVGSFVIEKADTPRKLIALPDGWFALMFRDRPGVIKFKPGEPTYYWWVFDPTPEDYGMRAKDFVFAEGSFWLVGDDFPTVLLVEVPEKALQKAEFAKK